MEPIPIYRSHERSPNIWRSALGSWLDCQYYQADIPGTVHAVYGNSIRAVQRKMRKALEKRARSAMPVGEVEL